MTKNRARKNLLPDEIIGAILAHLWPQAEDWVVHNDVNITDDLGRTVLCYAVMSGNHQLTKLLLKENANPNLTDKTGWSPLHHAAARQDITAARLLIDSGAKIDAKDNYGNTPLWRAVFESRGYGDMICFLLQKGADPVISNNYGVSPFKLAHTIANYDVRQFFSRL